jgi:hypothetical protein
MLFRRKNLTALFVQFWLAAMICSALIFFFSDNKQPSGIKDSAQEIELSVFCQNQNHSPDFAAKFLRDFSDFTPLFRFRYLIFRAGAGFCIPAAIHRTSAPILRMLKGSIPINAP